MGKGKIRTPGPERIKAADRRNSDEDRTGPRGLQPGGSRQAGIRSFAGSRETVDLPFKRRERQQTPVAS